MRLKNLSLIHIYIEQERSNFLRETKIKTLSLFFIDSIESYRGEDGYGSLRCKFQDLLRIALEEEYNKFKNSKNIVELEDVYKRQALALHSLFLHLWQQKQMFRKYLKHFVCFD